jgi:hypothetical protein
MPRSLSRMVVAMAVVSAGLAMTASTASAAVSINGDPMTVYVGPQGQLQARVAGGADGIYYAPFSDEGDAGFFLAFPPGGGVWGFEGTAGPEGLEPYVPVGQGPVTGDGSSGNPFTQVTEYEVPMGAGGIRVTETTTYLNGETQFMNKWEVKNESGILTPVRFRAFAAADFYFEGDDRGTGVFTEGPPRFIGGTNVDTGRSGGFVEVTGAGDGVSPPWSHYQELPWPNVWTDVIEKAGEGAQFNDTVDPNDEDNAGGVEWDQYESIGLGSGESATFELIGRVGVPAALRLEPTNAGAPQGVPIFVTATALDSSDAPYAGKVLRYDITGVNPGNGALTLNSAGQAVIGDPGTNAGGDTISAFVDFNDNGTREPNEPQASALATFVDNIPSSCKVAVKGDRPGGRGGAGNKLVIRVNCSEAARLTIRTTLFAPRLRRHHKRAHRSSATASKKHKKGKKRRKKRKIRLPKATATVQPGVGTAVKIKVPKGIARRYAGRKLEAKVVATVRDGAGNLSTARSTSKVKIKSRHKKHRKHRKHGSR